MRSGWPILLLSGAILAAGPAFAATSTAGWGQPNPPASRATAALNMLEAQGDGQFTNFTASGRDFTADVTKNGQVEHVLVNPDTHQIAPAGA